jgi:uncharacterized membrane protein HdeD (DUF308 family)
MRSGTSDHPRAHGRPTVEGDAVIILGLILLVIGFLTGLSLLYYIGAILLILGVIFLILGRTGRPVGGRKVWF